MDVFLFSLSVVLLVAGNFAIWRQRTTTKISVVPASLRLNLKKGRHKVQLRWQEAGTGSLGYGDFEIEMMAVHQTEEVDGAATIQIQKNGFQEVIHVDIYVPKETKLRQVFCTQHQDLQEEKKMKILSVANKKGGAGKTTSRA